MMHNNATDVSVIIPYYNSEKTIKRALDSVLSQSLKPIEVLIIDDKSNNASYTYLKELVKLYRKKTSVQLYVYSLTKNSGAGDARNYGLRLSSGDLIAFLDSDDAWHPKKLEIQRSFFLKDQSLMLCGHAAIIFEKEDEICNKFDYTINFSDTSYSIITKRKQLFRNSFATSTVMIRNDSNFQFEPNKRYSEDFLLWSEIICSGHKAIKFNLPLTVYFKPIYGSSGLSSHMLKMYKGNISSYISIYKKKYIAAYQLFFYIWLSTIKYIKRLSSVHINFF